MCCAHEIVISAITKQNMNKSLFGNSEQGAFGVCWVHVCILFQRRITSFHPSTCPSLSFLYPLLVQASFVQSWLHWSMGFSYSGWKPDHWAMYSKINQVFVQTYLTTLASSKLVGNFKPHDLWPVRPFHCDWYNHRHSLDQIWSYTSKTCHLPWMHPWGPR